jgi:hypothetical protein
LDARKRVDGLRGRDKVKDRREAAMAGKRVQFDDETWNAIDALASEKGMSFQDLADEAFKDLLNKHHQPVGLMAALKESVGEKGKKKR